MNSKVSEIKALFDEKIASVTSSDKIEELRVEFLGKKGYVAGLMGELKNIPNEEKKEFGQVVNVIKQEIEATIISRPVLTILLHLYSVTLKEFWQVWASQSRITRRLLTTITALKHLIFQSITLHVICRIRTT